ncbi:hypothetical protein TNCV_1685621 [Trichonephila clavipes]|nr:hypothetical protein TNCV_1685621 [Trichonephila clavipes]
MSDYKRIITGSISHIDSCSESKISVNKCARNGSLLSDFSCGVDRLDQHLTSYPITKKRPDVVDRLIERHGVVKEKKGRLGILLSLFGKTVKSI